MSIKAWNRRKFRRLRYCQHCGTALTDRIHKNFLGTMWCGQCRPSFLVYMVINGYWEK